ncbi:hypothetical protein Q5427_08070 [Brochothrix thermosphacta]|nr:hypothetical protein [Brochothrix thermosphacta]MDO7864253.1 hypothetical protein [Brochothrix thermosphacta]
MKKLIGLSSLLPAVKEVETDTKNTEDLTPDETRQEADHEKVNRTE